MPENGRLLAKECEEMMRNPIYICIRGEKVYVVQR
jgi:hypothetical protein